DAKARVWLENAQFDIVVRWLEELQIRRGVVVESSMIEKLNEAGLINARIVFQIAEDQ
ncbi:type II secretion system protein GspM, partial [Kaarinaea lacus]